MLRQVRLLVLDLDYLLYNCTALKARAVRDSLIPFADDIPQDVRLPDAVDVEEAYRDYGLNWVRMLNVGLDDERMAEVQSACRLHEQRLIAAGAGSVYPGLLPILTACRNGGVSLAIGAEATRDYLLAVSDTLELDSVFEVAYCTEEFGLGSADEMFEEILGRAEVNPSESLVLATRPDFFRAAHNLDLVVVGCGWGLHDRKALAEADLQVSAMEQLRPALERADAELESRYA